jgi:ClpP class serine protease
MRKLQTIPAFKALVSSKWLMTNEAMQAFCADMISYFLFIRNNEAAVDEELPPYILETEETIQRFAGSVNVTRRYSDEDLPDGSVAFHLIRGTILSDDNWFFSSKSFRRNIIAAENNPQIDAHFFLIESGGGEAWYLDMASAAVREAKKPIIASVEKVAASAAYYLAAYADKIYATTKNDVIGSIGTMVSFFDLIPFMEKLGMNYIEEYAEQSKLKNQKYNELRKGNPEKFIKEELNPLAEQFIADTRSARQQLAALKTDHPTFQGETYDTANAQKVGLIDGVKTPEEALKEAASLGEQYREKQKKTNKAFSLIN